MEIFTAENLLALLALTGLEIALGIDNIVFIAILTGRLPEHERPRARRLGLGFAMISRILLLLSLSWMMQLDEPLFQVPWFDKNLSGRDLILLGGGLFLIGKATHEIHHRLEEGVSTPGDSAGRAGSSVWRVITQIMIIDVVFSLDSVITAVGMARALWVMIAAVVISVIVMMVFAGPISRFVERHVTIKILALSFLILIGVMLVAEALGQHINKGYIYFAMAFALVVEMINLRVRKTSH